MKKLICAALALCLSVGLAACGAGEKPESDTGGINVTTPSAPVAVSRPKKAAVDVVKVTEDGVNVRSAASTEGEIYGQADKDEYYLSKGQEGDWNKIVYDGKEAYISAGFSAVEQVPEAEVSKLIQNGAAEGEGSEEESAPEENSEESSEESAPEPTPAPESEAEPTPTPPAENSVSDIRSSEDGQAR